MRAIPIDTTQNVQLEYEIASVGERILNAVLDNLVFFGWIAIISILVAALDLETTHIIVITILLLPVFYPMVCELFTNGKSIDNTNIRIPVLTKYGTKPSLAL